MSSNKLLPILLGGAALAAVGAVLFWPKKASAAPAQPRPAASPLPAPSPSPVPAPAPTPAAPSPPPVPIPPKLDPSVGPGSQVEYPLLVTGNGVNVRSGPGTNYAVLTTVNSGQRLRLPHSNSWSAPTAGAPQGWSGVILPDGRSGWIASQYVTIPPS